VTLDPHVVIIGLLVAVGLVLARELLAASRGVPRPLPVRVPERGMGKSAHALAPRAHLENGHLWR